MQPATLRCLTVVFTGIVSASLLAGAPVVASGQRSGAHKWWQSDRFKAELELTADQTSRLEAVFQDHLPRLRELKAALDREQQALSALLKDGTGAESVVAAQIDRVEIARGELSKLRTLMLFRMRGLLSADQRIALDDLHRRAEEEHRNRASGSGSGR